MSAEELAKAVNAVENWLYGVWPDLSPAHVRTVLEALAAHPPQPDALPGDLREQIADLAGESAAMTGKFEPKDWCVDVAVPNVTALLDTLERQAAEIERLRGALSFYAEPENWHGTYSVGHAPMNDDWDDDLQHPLYPDGKLGKRARAALTGED